MKRITIGSAAAAMCGVFLSSPQAFAVTIAQEPAPTIIASAPMPRGLEVLANQIGAITVSGHQSGLLSAQSRGHATRVVRAIAGQPAVLTRLDLGTRYQVTLNGKRIGFANVVGQVGATNELKVETTDVVSEVSLSWTHTVNKGEGLPVIFTVGASASKHPVVKNVTVDNHTVLKGLDTNVKYTFTVTASNSASSGRVSTAVMQRTLSEISGVSIEIPLTQTVVSPSKLTTTLDPVAPVAAPSEPQPTTRIIFICPDGFTEAGSLCEKTLAYTFHAVITTRPFTYHQQFIQTGSHVDFSSSPNSGTFYSQDQWNPTDGSPAGFYAVIPDGYSITVKDAPPTGFTDGGTSYTKTDNVKDVAPIGYADNGAAWVITAAKFAKVVPI
jgi:hypothetical protein